MYTVEDELVRLDGVLVATAYTKSDADRIARALNMQAAMEIAGIQNPYEKAAAAGTVFGKRGVDTLEILTHSADCICEARAALDAAIAKATS